MVMITTVYTLESALGVAFATTCGELAEARLQRHHKDSPANRAAVAEARARIDAVLDMYLEAGGIRR